jgi:hypothetical protein
MEPVSLRLASYLNALARARLSVEVAAHSIAEPDAAHHVIDRTELLGLRPDVAHPLEDALEMLRNAEPDGWLLALPRPGAIGALRGPRELNEAALQAGEAVIGTTAGLALVPNRVGPAIQWRLFPAERPFAPPTPYEAERELNETILSAAAALDELGVAAGSRPRRDRQVGLAPGYSDRQAATAERASRLLEVCDAAMRDDGAAISFFEADRRWQVLRRLRAAAGDALCAAISHPPQPQRSPG